MKKRILIIFIVIASLIAAKAIWVMCATCNHGSLEDEKIDIIHRANYLTKKVIVNPEVLLNGMPSIVGEQFQGEWAIYTCSMTCAALANIATLYPQNRETSRRYIGQIIEIALSEEIRAYDRVRWGEDPLRGIAGNLSHMSYYSHLAWMISAYKQSGGDGKYDDLYHSLCEALNRRMLQSETMNLQTYPGECIYVPDMLLTIVALTNYSRQNNGEYNSTVERWIQKAKTEWIDSETGMLASFLPEDENSAFKDAPIKGAYSALNCYYLTFIDKEFAKDQYEKLKQNFLQELPLTGIREYTGRSCWLGFDMDAGPVIMNLSSSGTGFAIGAATFFEDYDVRKKLLRTVEIGGSTVTWFGTSHYLVSNIALVAEAILLAMRTTVEWNNKIKN